MTTRLLLRLILPLLAVFGGAAVLLVSGARTTSAPAPTVLPTPVGMPIPVVTWGPVVIRQVDPPGPPSGEFERTKGTRVTIVGREVQLPPDTGIDGGMGVILEPAYGVVVLPAPAGSPPLEHNWVRVRRGDAIAYVGERGGRVEWVDPADQTASFDWLVEALRDAPAPQGRPSG